ncbi:unnamed protein product [Heterobilharzia americana]|nr:unnamed protein product [Heterobilharzia americana]
MDRDTSGGPVLKDTALSSEKRRYSVQNAAGPAGPVVERATSTQRISPRATPYLSVPTSTDVSPPGHLPRASIACNYPSVWRTHNDGRVLRTSTTVPLSIQAQLQQNQSVKSERPSLVLPTVQTGIGKGTPVSQPTPKLSISKNPEAESDQTKKLGRLPKSFRCECCQQVTVTRTTYQIGALTWLMAAFIFLCGGILGCFLIPFFVDCCKDVKHVCPFCGTEIGVVKCI